MRLLRPSIALALSFLACTVKAEQKPLIDLTDSSFSLRGRNQHDNDGNQTKNQIQYNVDLKVQFRLDKDGKWKLVTRTKTGASFESGWNDAGIGNNTEFVDDLAVRQIYVQYESNGNTASVGALPSIASADLKGILSIDEDGWVDGARLQTTNLGRWAKKVTVTFGSIDQLNTPAALSRKITTPNFIQIHVQGNIGQRIAYMVEGTEFDPANAPSEQYLRVMVDVATKDVLSFLNKIVIEPLIQNTSKPLQGFAVSAQMVLADKWTMTAQYSYKGHQLSSEEKLYAPREDFYREGNQASLFVTRKFDGKHPIEWSVGAGKTISGPRKSATGNALGLANTKGLRVETKLKFKF